MSNRLNMGLIGSGFMGQTHADSYRRAGILYRNLPRTPVLYAVADRSDELAEQARGRLGFQKAYGDWRKLIEDPAVDVIDITTPNNLHMEPALAAIEAGKHVFCEKPKAVKIEDARRMAAAAKQADVRTMVAFNNLKTPAALVAKQIIERGEIGEPIRFRGRFDQGFFNDPFLPWSWRCSRELAGTGALGDLGAHAVSVAQFLMGDIREVSAQSQIIFKERPVADLDTGYSSKAAADAKKRAVENEDQIQSLVKFESGLPVSSRLPVLARVGFSASFGKSRAQREQSITAENGLTSCRFSEWEKRSVIGDSKPSIAAHKCPSTPGFLASILPEEGLAILMCGSSKFTNSSTGLKAIGVVSLISHLAQGIKRSSRLWMSRPVPVPGSPLKANN